MKLPEKRRALLNDFLAVNLEDACVLHGELLKVSFNLVAKLFNVIARGAHLDSVDITSTFTLD